SESLPGVKELRILNTGHFFLELSWVPPTPLPQGYRITYGPRDGQLKERRLSRSATSVRLDNLQHNTEYVVTLYPLYPQSTAVPVIVTGRTCKYLKFTLQAVSQNSVRVKWRGQSEATGYRLNNGWLYSSCPLTVNTEYIITVLPLYGSTEGPPATASFKIESEEPQTLRTYAIGPSSIRVTWNLISTARGYRLEWKQATGREVSRIVAGGIKSYTIEGLQPDSAFFISVSALAGSREGRPVTVSARTAPDVAVGKVSDLQVLDTESKSIRIRWSAVPRATSYRITWRQSDGETVSGDITSFDIDNLQEDTTYSIKVSALVGSREGSPSTVEAKTGSDIIRVTWVGVQGATSYRVIWRRSDGENLAFITLCFFCFISGGPEYSRIVSSDVTSFDIKDLDGGVNYTVRVTALIRDREGPPVSINVKTRKMFLKFTLITIDDNSIFCRFSSNIFLLRNAA
uniref:Fibronectin type-III domain-containing protein n=1 Tax=Erpetoichthys calabaricus TaxID=27687 RepID=A0A8C4TP86_ERPCA